MISLSVQTAETLLAAARDRLAVVDREALLRAIHEVSNAIQKKHLQEGVKALPVSASGAKTPVRYRLKEFRKAVIEGKVTT